MSSAGEVVKFFLSKNWVVFALSIIAGFFATIAVPSDWRSLIPLDNNDWKTIVLFVVDVAIFYVFFSGILWLAKVIARGFKNARIKRKNIAADKESRLQNLKMYLTDSPDIFYSLVEHLVNNGNPWTYTFIGGGYEEHYMKNTDWFMIEDAPKRAKAKKAGKAIRQEIYVGRYKVKLHEWLYEDLKKIKAETGSLSHIHRDKYPIKWETAKSNSREIKNENTNR